MIEIKPPCDCIEKSGEYWVQQCYCRNSGDLSNSESWCTKQNMVEPLRAEIAALKAENKMLLEVYKTAEAVAELSKKYDGGIENHIRKLKSENAALKSSPWVSVDEFQSIPNEGHCWIKYKGRIAYAYHDHKQMFRGSQYSDFVFMTECVSIVAPINPPPTPDQENG